MARLCEILHAAGCYYSIENPASSMLWAYEPVAALGSSFEVVLDQCVYGLRPPHWESLAVDACIRNRTKIKSNLPALACLDCKCPGGHEHFRCLGNVKVRDKSVAVSKAAGVYPDNLAEAWARAVEGGAFDNRGRA